MWLLRVLGIWSLLAAMVALTIDGTKTIAGEGVLVITRLGEQWQQLNRASWQATKDALSGIHPFLWDVLSASLLQMPTWLVFGALGLFLYWLGRRRPRLNIYSN